MTKYCTVSSTPLQEGSCCSRIRSVKLFCPPPPALQHQRAKRMTKNGRSIAKRARDEAAGSLAPLTGGGLPCNARLKTTTVQCRPLVLCTTLLFLRRNSPLAASFPLGDSQSSNVSQSIRGGEGGGWERRHGRMLLFIGVCSSSGLACRACVLWRDHASEILSVCC